MMSFACGRHGPINGFTCHQCTKDKAAIEARIRKTLEVCIGHHVLITYSTIYTSAGSEERAFDTPILARIKATDDDNLIRWMDDCLDPLWDVEVLDHHGQLGEDDRLWSIYGLGWKDESYETTTCNEWTWATPVRFTPPAYIEERGGVIYAGQADGTEREATEEERSAYYAWLMASQNLALTGKVWG